MEYGFGLGSGSLGLDLASELWVLILVSGLQV